MDIFNDSNFQDLRNFIKKQKAKSNDWDTLYLTPYFDHPKKKMYSLNDAIEEICYDTCISQDILTIDVWHAVLDEYKNIEAAVNENQRINNSTVIPSEGTFANASLPISVDSMWIQYKKYLLEKKGFSTVMMDTMELETFNTLRMLSNNTESNNSIKGMVIGYVQSGKTSNMAALMSMAADNGFNLILILSGSIDNLRKQTSLRMIEDLQQRNAKTLKQWEPIERLQKSNNSAKLENLNLENKCYFSVCLKNVSRLRDVTLWLDDYPSKLQKLKVLLIDDEADQASVNTKANIEVASTSDPNYDKTKINELITNLVNNISSQGNIRQYPYGAMNYVMYTATPYANFLNESFSDSLYPSSFITTLTPSTEYFGAKQIFGDEQVGNYGLNILRPITDSDIIQVNELEFDNRGELPQSLKNSILWFLLATSARRVYRLKKPSSMLIHESYKQNKHTILEEAVTNFLKTNVEELLIDAKYLWEKEVTELQLSDVKKLLPNYNFDEENDYPKFEELVPFFKELLNNRTPIKFDRTTDEAHYHSGIHLAIDNSSNNRVNENNEHYRLLYPTKELPFDSPAFIVIGGNTLSRGLTIEGLVSTYFIRNTKLGDSLMQMARWFGFRKNYELLPRIWMDSFTLEKFQYLTLIEEDLRVELKRFKDGHVSPKQFGPHIKNTSNESWLRITAKNKMNGAIEVAANYAYTNTQLITYTNDKSIIKNNINITENFIHELAKYNNPKLTKSDNKKDVTAVYWEYIDFNLIYHSFLEQMKFEKNSILFGNVKNLYNWTKKVQEELHISTWNVIVGGIIANEKTDNWNVGGVELGKITRNKIPNLSSKDIINIGVLRTPRDLYADIDISSFDKNQNQQILDNHIRLQSTMSSFDVAKLREIANLDRTPQLLIYRISKDSKPSSNNSSREPLKSFDDLIGVSIYIPSMGQEFTDKLTVQMKYEIKEEEI